MQDEEQVTIALEANREEKAPSLASSTAKMSIATTASRATGFLRNMALAFALGSGVLNDTFSTANVMPNIIFELLMGGILGSVIIPVYVEYLSKKSDGEARHMLSNLTNIIFALAAIVSLLGAIFAPFLVHLITIREPSKATPLMVMFFRVFAFQIMFYALAAVFSGVLNAKRRFTVPMAAPILNNTVVIITVLGLYLPFYKSNPQFALMALAVGTTAGVVVLALIQVPFVIRAGLQFRPSFNLRHPAVRQVARLGLPMLGFAATVQLNNYVIYMLLQSSNGGAMAYQNALAFFQLPYAIFAVSITTAIFPELSRFANSKDFKSFKRTLSLGLRSASFIMIPSAVFLAVMAKPIIALTLQHGKFDAAGTEITAAMLATFALALLSFSLYNMLTRVYYSLQDTKTPMIIGAVSVPLQIVFNFLFIDIIGVSGLPLAYGLALTLGVFTQLYLLRQKIGPLGASVILKAIIRQLAAVIPAGIAMYLAYRIVESFALPRMLDLLLEIIGAATAGFAIYMGLALLLGIKEVDFIKQISRRFLRARVKPVL